MTREEKSAPEWMSTIKQVMKIKTDRHFVFKKEENNSPNAEKNERLRGRNGRSTSKKEKSGRARGGGKEDGRAPSARRGRARGPARTPTPAASGPTMKAAVVDGVPSARRRRTRDPAGTPTPAAPSPTMESSCRCRGRHKSPLPTLVPKGKITTDYRACPNI